MSVRRVIVLAGLLVPALLALTAPAQAQQRLPPNPDYDGRPTFVRLRYDPVSNPDGCQQADGLGGVGWTHDYPAANQGLMKAATELTSLEAPVDSSVVLRIDDSLLLKYPVAYLSEPGCWSPTEKEAQALRAYLRKGGFLIADDFTFSAGTPELCQLAHTRFEEYMQRVLPEGKLVPLAASDPLFDGFFTTDPTAMPNCAGTPGQIRGIYEANDPTKRLLVVANYTRSLAHRWRWAGGLGSGLGARPEASNAYKLGLNYLVYGLSH